MAREYKIKESNIQYLVRLIDKQEATKQEMEELENLLKEYK